MTSPATRSCISAVCAILFKRRHRRAGRHRIGGVGGDQQRRMLAAPHRALEPARDLHAEQHGAGLQQVVELLDGADLMREAEIGGVLQRLQHRAGEIAVLLQQHRGRQVARRGVDRIAEQEQLHHRDHDDHRERHAVALELDELLHQHREGAPQRAETRLALLRAVGRHAHWKLSCARFISSMNTSSSDGSLRCQRQIAARAIGRDGRLQRLLVAARHVQAVAERRDHVDARLAGQLRLQSVQLGAVDGVGDQRRLRDHLARPCRASAAGRRRCRRSHGSARPRPCSGWTPARSARHGRARGSRSRIRAAPSGRRRRSARRAAAVAGSAACRRRAQAAASSRRTARRQAAPRGRSGRAARSCRAPRRADVDRPYRRATNSRFSRTDRS